MAEVKLTILATSKDGYKVSGSVEGDDFTAAIASFQNLKDFAENEGWQADGAGAAAARVFGGTPNTQTQALTCIFDGTAIEGIEVEGKVFSAQQIADGRTDKMAKMGKRDVGPVCGDCWKSKGLSADWKTHYAANKPRGRY